MNFDLTRNKLILLGSSGVLAIGAAATVAVAARASNQPTTAPTVQTTPTETEAPDATEKPEVQGAPDADGPGGHADAAGADANNQHEGQGESDG